jgi:phosphoglycolate phosphatase
MEKQKSFKLILFDLDGTLVKLNFNAEKTRERLREFYKKYGIKKEFKPVLKSIEESTQKISERFGRREAETTYRIAIQILEEEEKLALEGSEILPFAREALDHLRRSGYTLGVVSRTSRSVVNDAVRKYNLSFDIVIAREDAEKTKPHPEPINLALRKLKINPEECILLGDHPYDIISGKRAGVITAGILTGTANEEDLRRSGADYIIKNLKEFIELVKSCA